MQALRFHDTDNVSLDQVPVPEVTDPTDVLIKVNIAGVCGTDLHIIQGHFETKPHVIIGHEAVGTVVKLGDQVKHLKVGDRVALDPHGHCGSCFYCAKGCMHFCVNKAQHPSMGMKRDGAFAPYILAPEAHVEALRTAVSDEQGILLEPFSCILHAVNRAEPIAEGDKVVVLGAGIIGLLATIYLSHRGVKSVTVVELVDHRRETVDSLKLPGVQTTSPNDMQADRDKAEGDPTWGYDLAFDFTGAAPAIQLGFDVLRKRGKLVLFGVMRKDAKVHFSPHDILYKEITVTGAFTNPGTMNQAVKVVEELSKANLLTMEVLDIKKFPLSRWQEALEALKAGSIAKAMLIPE